MTTSAPKNHGHLCYPYGDTASSDEAILAGVLNALHWHPGIPQDQVKVEVRHGCAVLSGKVAHMTLNGNWRCAKSLFRPRRRDAKAGFDEQFPFGCSDLFEIERAAAAAGMNAFDEAP